jgi:hypothetical protein
VPTTHPLSEILFSNGFLAEGTDRPLHIYLLSLFVSVFSLYSLFTVHVRVIQSLCLESLWFRHVEARGPVAFSSRNDDHFDRRCCFSDMLALGRTYFSTARSLLIKTPHRAMSTAERLVVVGIPFPDDHRARLAPHFAEIAYFADGKATDAAALEAADVLYGNLRHISTFDAIKNVKFAQLSNAGADDVLANAFWKEDERASKVLMATVAGVHMAPISQVHLLSLPCSTRAHVIERSTSS